MRPKIIDHTTFGIPDSTSPLQQLLWMGFEAQLAECGKCSSWFCSKLHTLYCNISKGFQSMPYHFVVFPSIWRAAQKCPKMVSAILILSISIREWSGMGLSGQEWFFCPVRGYFQLDVDLCFETLFWDPGLLSSAVGGYFKSPVTKSLSNLRIIILFFSIFCWISCLERAH